MYFSHFNIFKLNCIHSFDNFIKNFIAKKVCAGIFTILPLGKLLQNKIENVIRNHQNKIGVEVCMPTIAPQQIFINSGRTETFLNEMITFKDNKQRVLSMCPTCEEVSNLTFMYNNISYHTLPKYIYQITTKVRDEIRPRNYILRCCEFVMKDGYSFATDEEQHKEIYTKIKISYINILKILNINVHIIEADSKEMLGKYSEEFIHPHSTSECKYTHEGQQKTGIEIGHIFNLSTIYTQRTNTKYTDKQNKQHYIHMGSYGLGVYRIMYIAVYNLYYNKVLPTSIILFKFVFIPRTSKHKHNKDNILTVEYNYFKHIVDALLYDEYADKHTYFEKIEIVSKLFTQYVVYENNYKIYVYDVISKIHTEIQNNIREHLTALIQTNDVYI